jgi:hypothetical protein
MYAAAVGGCLLLLASRALGADGVRCGENLVGLGDTEAQVLDRCGEPTTRARKTFDGRRSHRAGHGRPALTWDQWVYDAGPTAFVRILTFDAAAGRLIHVELGDYGR